MKPVLTRAAGRFTNFHKSDVVVNFVELPEHMLKGSTDLYEVILYRSLRRGIRTGAIQGLGASGESFYLIVASILRDIIACKPRRNTEIVNQNETLGSLFEALKLIGEISDLKNTSFHPKFSDMEHRDGFRVLHEIADNLGSDIDFIIDDEVREEAVGNNRRIFLWDFFNTSSDKFSLALNEIIDAAKSDNNECIVIGRVSVEKPIRVVDVYNNSYRIPSLSSIAKTCEEHKLWASFFLFHNFDRDYFLPFEGIYGVAVLHIVPKSEDLFLGAEFRQLTFDGTSGAKDLVISKRDQNYKSYDSLFSFELPSVQENKEPDWNNFKSTYSTDLTLAVWNGGQFIADPAIMALFTVEENSKVEEFVYTITSADKDKNWLSVRGLCHAAVIMRYNHPEETVRFLFRAMQYAGDDHRTVKYIRDMFIEYFAPRELPISDEIRHVAKDHPIKSFLIDVLGTDLVEAVGRDGFVELVTDEVRQTSRDLGEFISLISTLRRNS